MEVSSDEDGKWLYFGEEDYAWPAEKWNSTHIGVQMKEKIIDIESKFKKKNLQYQNLYEEFQELFQNDCESDEELEIIFP
jgi:hypothetical protein